MSRSGVDESCLMVLIKIQLNALSLLNEMSVKFMKKTKKGTVKMKNHRR